MGELVGIICTVIAVIIAIKTKQRFCILIAAYFLLVTGKDEWLVYTNNDIFVLYAGYGAVIDWFAVNFLVLISSYCQRCKVAACAFAASSVYSFAAVLGVSLNNDLFYTQHSFFMAVISLILVGLSADAGRYRSDTLHIDADHIIRMLSFGRKGRDRCQKA